MGSDKLGVDVGPVCCLCVVLRGGARDGDARCYVAVGRPEKMPYVNPSFSLRPAQARTLVVVPQRR